MKTFPSGQMFRAPKRSQWFQKPFLVFYVLLLVLLVVGNTIAQSPPLLDSVSPADGTTGVATDTSITFNFDPPISANSFLLPETPGFPGSGNFKILPTNISYSSAISIDGSSVTITLASPPMIPLNTVVTWELNPAGTSSTFLLKNAGGELGGTKIGTFTTTGDGSPAPTIVSVTPDYNVTDVSPSSSITFTFDQDMDTSTISQLGIPPSSIGNYQITPLNYSALFFDAEWSEDGRSLTLINSAPVALGTTISWTLNPENTPTPLKAAHGEPLVETSGSFTIIENTGGNPNEFCDPMGDPNGVYLITKVFAHEQNAASVVIPSESPQPILNASALEAQGVSAVTGGSITIPGGNPIPLNTLYGPFGYYSPRDTETELNAAFPPGDYTLMFSQENGSEHAIAMNMPATSTTSVPTILNFNEAQSIDASKDFEFHWEAQTLNTESEILFSISDEIGNLIFMAPNTCIPRELPPSATSATVPAGYLKPGLKYRGVLRFGNIFYHSDSEVMDMVGIGAIYRFTTFPIQTGTGGTGGGIIPATFAEFGFNTEGKPTFSVSGSPIGTYLIQRSPTIVDPNWITQETLILDGTGIDIFVDNDPDLTFPAFYQAVGN